MPNKTLSVRRDDLPLWERVERAAKEARTTVSALVATALARYLGETGTIRVLVCPPGEQSHYEEFEGRWLVDADLDSNLREHDMQDPRFALMGRPEEWRVGVAETGRGQIAVYLHHWNYSYHVEPMELLVFASLDDAEHRLHDDPRVPVDLFEGLRISPARAPVVWRDI